MPNPIDISGQRFGHLVALRPLPKGSHPRGVLWECRCDCGGTARILTNCLTKGNSRSCGCKKKEALDVARLAQRPDEAKRGRVVGDHYEVPVVDGAEILWAKVDLAHGCWAELFAWNAGNGYAATKINGRRLTLHHCILRPEPGLVVDHINRNRLDNRSSNLRVVTIAENLENSDRRDSQKARKLGLEGE